MKQIDSTPKWLETAPPKVRTFVLSLADLATTALKNETPYHSVRVVEHLFTESGTHSGRVIGWCISMTTQFGWEYENATCDRQGTMWLMFKNPYVFS
jgi:hypothetical protein